MRAKTVRKKLAVLWVLGLVIVAGLGFTGWFAYHSSQAADDALKSANKVSSDTPKLPQVKTYADCQKSPGSKTLLTYPAQCMTAGGKTFTDNSQKYLVIKEWGVKIPLTANESDLTYVPETSEGITFYRVESPSIAKLCGQGWDGTIGILGRKLTDPSKQGSVDSQVKVGSYYYTFAHIQNACGNTDAISRQHSDASTALQTQFKLMQAE